MITKENPNDYYITPVYYPDLKDKRFPKGYLCVWCLVYLREDKRLFNMDKKHVEELRIVSSDNQDKELDNTPYVYNDNLWSIVDYRQGTQRNNKIVDKEGKTLYSSKRKIRKIAKILKSNAAPLDGGMYC